MNAHIAPIRQALRRAVITVEVSAAIMVLPFVARAQEQLRQRSADEAQSRATPDHHLQGHARSEAAHFAAGVAPVRAQARAQEVSISGPAGRLAGTLTLPGDAFAPPYPVVVTLTGSGAHHRDGNRTPDDPYRPFRQIASSLAAKGVAVLRMDDRGVGGSTGDAAAASGDDVADDVRAAVAWLRTRDAIAPDRIALLGHSFGGWVAPMVAAEDPDIAAMALMGAPARSFREIMRYQLRHVIESDSTIPPEGRQSELEARVRQQARNVAASSEQWRIWAQDRDPLPTLRRVQCPVLILQGSTDRAVSLEDAATLARTLRDSGNPNVVVRTFEGVNHHFQRDAVGSRAGYYDLPTQDLAQSFLDALSDWMAERLQVGPHSSP